MKKVLRWILFFLLLAGGALLFREVIARDGLPYQEQIIKISAENGVAPYLIAAIIKSESNFNEMAESPKYAKGLMQITEETEKWICRKLGETYDSEDWKKPEINIRRGSWYFKYLLDRYEQNKNLALLAYNAGFGNVDKWLQDGTIKGRLSDYETVPFEESRNYLLKNRIYEALYQYLYDWKI